MSAAGTLMGLGAELVAIVGGDHVIGGEALVEPRLEGFAIDAVSPLAVVSPASAAETAAVLRFAAKSGLAVVPYGGGTKQGHGRVPQEYILLRSERMNQVAFYDPGDLTFGIGAGATVGDVESLLSPNAQMLPLDIAEPSAATIGGVLASGAFGAMKCAYGAPRDYCIGIEFVTAEGKIAHGGGRVVKNVAGYDLMRLLIGSFGGLGVITSANFKLFPALGGTRTFVCESGSLAEATAFRDQVMASPLTPLACEIVSPAAHEYLTPAGEARDPDVYAPENKVKKYEHWSVLVRAAGSERVLARFARELGSASTRALAGAGEHRLWSSVADLEPEFARRHQNAMVLHCSVPISAVRATLEAGERSAIDNNMLFAAAGRATTGDLLLGFAPLAVDPPSAMQYANAVSSLRGELPRDGSAVVSRCPKEAKPHFDLWGSSSTDIQLMRQIKRALDPKGVLNPGRSMA